MTRVKIGILTSLILLISLAGYLVFVFGVDSGGDSDGWRGYHLLLIPEEEALRQDIPSLIDAAGFGVPLSLETAQVMVTDFAEGRFIPLSGLNGHLLNGDPRRDPFLDRVSSLFYQDGYRIYYIETALPAGRVYRRLAPVLEPVNGWVFPSHKPGVFFPSLLLLGACGVVHLLFSSRKPLAILMALLPGLAVLAAQEGLTVMAGAVLAISSLFLIPATRFRFSWQVHMPAAAGALSGLILMLRGGGWGGALFLLGAVMAAGALSLAVGDREGLRVSRPARKRSEHPLFEPLFLGGAPPRAVWRFFPEKHPAMALVPLPSLLLLSLLLVFLTGNGPGGPVFPVPDRSTGGWGFKAVSEAWSQEPEPLVPGGATYAAHRFFQDHFLFGSAWGDPFAKKKVSISTFSERDGRISRIPREMRAFNPDDWSDIVSGWRSDPLFELFYRQNTAAGPVLSCGGGISSVSLRWWEALAFLLPVLFSGLPGVIQSLSGKRNDLSRRYAAEWRKY